MKTTTVLCIFLLATHFALPSDSFVIKKSTSTQLLAHSASITKNEGVSTSQLFATQLAEFVEPTTGVTVKMVGSMHYNPASIELAQKTIEDLANDDKLGSIVIESCDLRWNASASANEPEWLKKLMFSEMKAAHDLGMEYNRPVVLGDQRINITVSQLGNGFGQTFKDLSNPIGGGWKSFITTVNEARKAATPVGDKDYLGPMSFFEPKFVLAAPIALYKYPLSYIAKAPFATAAFLGLLFFAESANALPVEQLSTTDWIGEIILTTLEVSLFARVFLKELLAERNEILAKNILKQCELYENTPSKWERVVKQIGFIGKKDDAIMYAPDTAKPKFDGEGKKEVVVVVGAAHCNGIIKLLKEQRV